MLIKIFSNRLRIISTAIAPHRFTLPYWVKITTKQPDCTYYFGPFDSYSEAKQMQHGYIDDLIAEKATGISVVIKRCMPTKLTIAPEEEFFKSL
jgi:hypothetical protein